MDAKDLAKRFQREREFWVELAPGKRMKFLRPELDESGAFVVQANSGPVGRVAEYLRGWEGITVSDFLPDYDGDDKDDPAEYDFKMGKALLRDHMSWGIKVSEAVMTAMIEHRKRTEDVEKNSVTSST